VVDPRLSLATANLVRVDRLTDGRPPAAAILDPAEAVLWAALPDEDAVLRHDLAAGGPRRARRFRRRPSDLAGPLPDLGEGAVAVGLDGPGAVARLDRDGRETVRRGVGRGPVRLALGAGRLAALAAGDGRLAVLDPWTLEVRGALPLGGPAAALALVDRQDLALVAAGNRLVVVGIGGGTPPSVLAEVRLGVTPDRLAASPDGRWAFALDRARSAVAIVDLARGPRLAHALAFEEGAEELAIGLDLLYVRLRDAPAVAILPFAALERPDRDGTPVVERVTMGAAPTGAAGRSLMAPGPGGRGLWLAHPADRRAYLFTGGAMRAPETAVPLKGSTPAGLLSSPSPRSPAAAASTVPPWRSRRVPGGTCSRWPSTVPLRPTASISWSKAGTNATTVRRWRPDRCRRRGSRRRSRAAPGVPSPAATRWSSCGQRGRLTPARSPAGRSRSAPSR
jgi:hypothetical protein